MIYFKKIITTFIFISVIFSENVINPDLLRYKVAYATRCEMSPVIDGILDETVWDNSVVISDFLQLVPIEFDKPSEKTQVRILYDDNAIYISFLNFDSNPKKIRAPLTRRDAYMDGFNTVADFIGVAVDSRNDDFNGKWFGEYPLTGIYIGRKRNFYGLAGEDPMLVLFHLLEYLKD